MTDRRSVQMSDENKHNVDITSGSLNQKDEPQTTQANKPESKDSLAGWAIWAVIFAGLSVTIVGGAIGGLIAGIISFLITKALPVRSDGRKLPVTVSTILMLVAIILFVGGRSMLMKR